MPFPLAFVYPNWYRNEATSLIAALTSVDVEVAGTDQKEFEVLERFIEKNAKECLDSLAVRLGNEAPFFFGQYPSSLDALVFAYVAPMIKINFPSSSSIANHARQHTNLTQFVVRILHNYFPGASSTEQTTTDNDANDNGTSTRATILRNVFPIGVAIVAMLGYAFSNGLIRMLKDLTR